MSTEQVDARPVLASALVTALDHVGIAVADLDATIKWYHDHLGMIVLHEEINEEQGVREAMLSVRGAPVGSAQIQLMAPLDETSTIAKFLDKRGPGLQQLAYRVSDIDALSDRLREQGVRLLYERRGAVPQTRGSTSFIPRTQAVCSSSSSSLPPITSRLRPLPRRTARCSVLPARGMPVPPVVDRLLSEVGLPHHQMSCARADLVVATRAPVDLGGPRCGDRPNFVVVSVRPCLDTTGRRQRRP